MEIALFSHKVLVLMMLQLYVAVEKNKLSEADSRKFFCQIVSAVAYMHNLGYAHRDLKPVSIFSISYNCYLNWITYLFFYTGECFIG